MAICQGVSAALCAAAPNPIPTKKEHSDGL